MSMLKKLIATVNYNGLIRFIKTEKDNFLRECNEVLNIGSTQSTHIIFALNLLKQNLEYSECLNNEYYTIKKMTIILIEYSEIEILEFKNENGDTALHLSSILGDYEIVKCLLQRNVNFSRNKIGNFPNAISKNKKINDLLFEYVQNSLKQNDDLKIKKDQGLTLKIDEIMKISEFNLEKKEYECNEHYNITKNIPINNDRELYFSTRKDLKDISIVLENVKGYFFIDLLSLEGVMASKKIPKFFFFVLICKNYVYKTKVYKKDFDKNYLSIKELLCLDYKDSLNFKIEIYNHDPMMKKNDKFLSCGRKMGEVFFEINNSDLPFYKNEKLVKYYNVNDRKYIGCVELFKSFFNINRFRIDSLKCGFSFVLFEDIEDLKLDLPKNSNELSNLIKAINNAEENTWFETKVNIKYDIPDGTHTVWKYRYMKCKDNKIVIYDDIKGNKVMSFDIKRLETNRLCEEEIKNFTVELRFEKSRLKIGFLEDKKEKLSQFIEIFNNIFDKNHN